jgi:hypothetical protein
LHISYCWVESQVVHNRKSTTYQHI